MEHYLHHRRTESSKTFVGDRCVRPSSHLSHTPREETPAVSPVRRWQTRIIRRLINNRCSRTRRRRRILSAARIVVPYIIRVRVFNDVFAPARLATRAVYRLPDNINWFDTGRCFPWVRRKEQIAIGWIRNHGIRIRHCDVWEFE